MQAIELQIPERLTPILEPKRFKVMHGGRGGGKSHTVAQVLLMLAACRKLRILCVREVQKSLRQSSMQVLVDYIDKLGMGEHFTVLKTEIRCNLTGSQFEFSGLKDHTADSIKSWEGADIVWVEEAHSVSAHSWNILIPTIRKPGSEIWATYNPDQEDDYVHDRFVVKHDPDAWVSQINWRDNPWFGKEMDTERQKLKALNDDLYQHVWEGKCRSVAGLLFKRHWFKRFPLGGQPSGLNLYMAADYAGGPDPDNPDSEPDWTEFGVFGSDQANDLFVVDWWSSQEDPAVWITAWIQLLRRHKPLYFFEEKGPILRALHGSMELAMRETQAYVMRYPLASASDKASRALGFAALAAAGKVWIPECDWGDRLINQLCAFNGQDGRVDDMVDVCSLFGRGIDHVWAHLAPKQEAKDVDALIAAAPKVSELMKPIKPKGW